MQLLDGRIVHSASDLNDYADCAHLIARKREVAWHDAVRPEREDATRDLIARKGDEHEGRYVTRLLERYGDAMVVFDPRSGWTRAAYEAAERDTVSAMRGGAPAIAQATFFDGVFVGRADVLRRVEVPSNLGAWSYEVIETKLALSPKPHFLVQLAHYSEHVARLQGVAPGEASIVLGNGTSPAFRVEDFAPYYRHLKVEYLASFEAGEDAYPLECTRCGTCLWERDCERRRDAEDDLSLVAGMRGDQRRRLVESGLETLGALAHAADERRPPGMTAPTFANLRAQAKEQNRYRVARASGTAKHSYSFRPAADGMGFSRLPEPQAGDIFFDMEGDPLYRPGATLEYLFGIYLPDDPADSRYRAFWGTTPADERTAFEGFIDFVTERRARYPALRIYHYAPYETAALKRLAGRFASREDALDVFLRAELFVDLYAVVRQALWISQPSYSIKKVEALYGFSRTTETKAGDDSIVNFETWLETQDPIILEDIRKYNEDDCASTSELRDWLVARRAERERLTGETIPWRDVTKMSTLENARPPNERALAAQALSERLLSDLDVPASEAELRAWPADDRERWLLGHLVNFHRREDKSEWWAYFDRLANPSELLSNGNALSDLELTDLAPYKHSPGDRTFVSTYTFPEQECDLGLSPVDAYTGKRFGDVVDLNLATREVAIKVAKAIDPAALRVLAAGGPLPSNDQAAELGAIAHASLDGRLHTEYPAATALVRGTPPRIAGLREGGVIQPGVLSLTTISDRIGSLESGALVVQGPPGTGKSTAGARAIVDLLARGKRVAIAAAGHAALHALCEKIEGEATERAQPFRGAHRESSSPSSAYKSALAAPFIVNAKSGLDAYDFVSAPLYGWSSALQKAPELLDSFDVVFIDEAGQVSLADALIISRLGRRLVLLGDPQQLPQVGKGSHPIGTEGSVLEHLLGEAATIAPDRGIFLETSYRLEPRLGAFVSHAFYDGRLRTAAANATNRVDAPAGSGAGPRMEFIVHDDRARRAPEEIDWIAERIASLIAGGTAAIRGEAPRLLTPADILVVTPYNAQRLALTEALEARGITGIKVGTVDKFQGQEAPVVFYSMATSRAELAPRGLDFLLSPNRFNVAISRAEALAIVTCSPLLAGSRATSVENMRLLSLLCAYAESAGDS